MGYFIGSITGGGYSSGLPTTMVDAFNALTDVIVGSGMLPVPAGDLPGQAGSFSVTGGGGDTIVGSPNTTPFSTNTRNYVGFNAFKHPTAGFYVVVYYENVSGGWDQPHAGFRYKLASGLVDGSLVGLTSVFLGSAQGFRTAQFAVTGSVRACAGSDFFWIAADPIFFSACIGNVNSLTSLRESGINLYVQEIAPDKLYVTVAQISAAVSSTAHVLGERNPPCCASYVQEQGVAVPLGETFGVSATLKPASVEGVRVVLPAYVVGDASVKIAAVSGALGDWTELNVDIAGDGVERRYVSSLGMGIAGGWYRYAGITNVFIPLLPIEG